MMRRTWFHLTSALAAHMLLALIMPAAVLAAPTDREVALNDGKVVVKADTAGGLEAQYKGKKYSLQQKTAGNFVFTDSLGRASKGSLAGGLLKLTGSDGKAILEIKLQESKVKLTAGGRAWELKLNPEKIKVVEGDKDLGKVDFYPDTGKTKAKDPSGATIAETKSFAARTASLGAFLLPALDIDSKMFVFLFLVANSW